MAGTSGSNERIQRRPAPKFEETESGLISGILEEGFLNVALNDANQYGPHAMIILLGIVATLTALGLGLAMLVPMIYVVILTIGTIGISYGISSFLRKE